MVAAAPAKTPIVAVVLNGRPLTINLVADRVPAILIARFPGEYGGRAVAEALFGDINPGGKLPVTFPRCARSGLSLCLFRVSYSQCDHLTSPPVPFLTHTVRRSVGQIEFGFPQKPGSQAGMGTGDDPNGVGYCLVTGALYPFGHGLSYTTFALENPALSADTLTVGRYTTPPSLPVHDNGGDDSHAWVVFACCAVLWVGGGAGEGVTVTVEVTNTGEWAGDEVVQLYLRDMVLHAPHTRIAHPTFHGLRFDCASDGILALLAPVLRICVVTGGVDGAVRQAAQGLPTRVPGPGGVHHRHLHPRGGRLGGPRPPRLQRRPRVGACVVMPRSMTRHVPPARIRMATGLPSLCVLLLPW